MIQIVKNEITFFFGCPFFCYCVPDLVGARSRSSFGISRPSMKRVEMSRSRRIFWTNKYSSMEKRKKKTKKTSVRSTIENHIWWIIYENFSWNDQKNYEILFVNSKKNNRKHTMISKQLLSVERGARNEGELTIVVRICKFNYIHSHSISHKLFITWYLQIRSTQIIHLGQFFLLGQFFWDQCLYRLWYSESST